MAPIAIIFFQPRDVQRECPIQFYALYYNIQQGVVPHGNVSLIFQNSSGKLLAGLSNVDTIASITCHLIYHMLFGTFIE